VTLSLAPGLRLVRRDAGLLQLGLEPPRVAVLPDSPAVRRLVAHLAAARPPGRLDADAARALAAITAAGLTADDDDRVARNRSRAAARVWLDVPEALAPALRQLVAASGLTAAGVADEATLALVAGQAAVARDRLDGWARGGVPHLLLTEDVEGWTVGPFVVPGRTACVRCLDAHRAESDPRHALVVERAATAVPLGPCRPDPALTTVALGWAVRDLVAAADGDRPSTWSATLALGPDLAPRLRPWRRHPHCGCAWADELATA
jgi:hypothetical protein